MTGANLLAIQTELDIVYRHEDFIVINKPVGVAMHSNDDKHRSVVSYLQAYHPHNQWFIVHRLDTPTSGCLLIAKHKKAAAKLGQLFESRQIEKFYLALSDKKPKKKQGMVKGDMQKARGGSYKLVESCDNPALTQFFSHSLAPNLRAFLCKPLSGKTHQIRVALKSQSAPIVGDERYATQKSESTDRLYLHSYGLRFDYQGEEIKLTCLPSFGRLFFDISQSMPNTWLHPWSLPWPSVKT